MFFPLFVGIPVRRHGRQSFVGALVQLTCCKSFFWKLVNWPLHIWVQFLPSKRLETHNNVAKSPTASTSSPGFHHTQRRYRFSPQDTTVCFQRSQDHKRIPLQACQKHMKSWMFHGGFVLVGKVASMLGSSVGLNLLLDVGGWIPSCCRWGRPSFAIWFTHHWGFHFTRLVCVCVGLFRGLILIWHV